MCEYYMNLYLEELDKEYERDFLMSLEEALNTFIGTSRYHRLTIAPVNCTDGVKYFAEHGEAFWCVETIAGICYSMKDEQDFIAIEVTAKENHYCEINFTDGDENRLHTEIVLWSDLEPGTYKFFYTDNVLMLRSEY